MEPGTTFKLKRDLIEKTRLAYMEDTLRDALSARSKDNIT